MKTVTFAQLRHLWPIYLLVLPALGLVLTFSYFPAASGIYHAFHRWNGDEISEWIGLGNFTRSFQDPRLGKAFVLVMILIACDLVKLIPSVIAAVVIHRLVSDRARYIYRVAFVIPMVIPGMVWLLMWKYFYNPTVGVLNGVLDRTGLMGTLNWLDTQMPRLAHAIAPSRDAVLSVPFGGIWGFGLFGVVCLAFLGGLRGIARGWLWAIGLLAAALFLWGPPAHDVSLWGFWTAAWWQRTVALPGFWQGMGRLGAILLVVGAAGQVARHLPAARLVLKWAGILALAAFAGLVLTSAIWTEQTRAFASGSPSWLGHEKLIVPSLIFWGFPWVGVLGVLLYLSGLGNIDQSVYEAADIDGCGPIRKFWNIELPLIMTQIRLNVVLMVIGTLQGWGLAFILLSDTGGPGGAGMMPGLYMFRMAFTEQEVGYACALGLLLFFLILYLTVINNKYVRVSK